jgi:hypothetical protein
MKRTALTLVLLGLTLAGGIYVGGASSSAQPASPIQELNLSSKVGSTCNVRSRDGGDGDSSHGTLSVVTDKWIVLDNIFIPKNAPTSQTNYQTWIPTDLITSIEFIEKK